MSYYVMINPGAQLDVSGTFRHALKNVRQLRRDVCAAVGVSVRQVALTRSPDDHGDRARRAFRLTGPKCERGVVVFVPGLPLAEVRTDRGLAPRLYVDGNSWWWKFAVSTLTEKLFKVDTDYMVLP